MCGGGGSPKVDTSYQDWSKKEANRARADEEARQNRIKLGMKNIAAIFEGGRGVSTSKTKAGGAYDPNVTYYNKRGGVWKPTAQKTVTTTTKTPGKAVQLPGKVLNRAKQPTTYNSAGVAQLPGKNARWVTTPSGVGGEYYLNQDGDLVRNEGPLALSPSEMVANGYAAGYPAVQAAAAQEAGRSTTTTTTGLTPAQQFQKLVGKLFVAGKGKMYAGVDPILAARRKAEEGYYYPQVDQNYKDASDEVTFALSRAGLGRSTTANKRRARLSSDFGLKRAEIASNIAQDINQAETGYQQQRQSLESQLRASGDATAASSTALANLATFAKDAPDLNPLENTFLGLAQGIGQVKSGYDIGNIRRAARGGSTVNRDLSKVIA